MVDNRLSKIMARQLKKQYARRHQQTKIMCRVFLEVQNSVSHSFVIHKGTLGCATVTESCIASNAIKQIDFDDDFATFHHPESYYAPRMPRSHIDDVSSVGFSKMTCGGG